MTGATSLLGPGQSDFGRIDISTGKGALGSMHWNVDHCPVAMQLKKPATVRQGGSRKVVNLFLRWDFSVMGAKSYVLNLSENVRRSLWPSHAHPAPACPELDEKARATGLARSSSTCCPQASIASATMACSPAEVGSARHPPRPG
jgi:hypothetical protein